MRNGLFGKHKAAIWAFLYVTFSSTVIGCSIVSISL